MQKNGCTNLPGYADRGEGIGPTREERPPAYQQNPYIVLAFILQTNALELSFSVWFGVNPVWYPIYTSDLPLLWHERFVSSSDAQSVAWWGEKRKNFSLYT